MCVFAVWLGWRFDGAHGPTRAKEAASYSDRKAGKEVAAESILPGNSLSRSGPLVSVGQEAFGGRQLAYATVSGDVLGLPKDLRGRSYGKGLSVQIPGRQIPPLTIFSELSSAQLMNRAVPLPEANTLAHLNYQQRRFGRVQVSGETTLFFNPEMVLVKFRGIPHVAVLRVEGMREWEAVQVLERRSDVRFARQDVFHP